MFDILNTDEPLNTSVISKIGVKAKIIILILTYIAILNMHDFKEYMLMFLLYFIIYLFSKIPLKTLLKGLKPIVYIFIFFVVFNFVVYQGHIGGANDSEIIFQLGIFQITKPFILLVIKSFLRLMLFSTSTLILILTSGVKNIVYGIEDFFSPLYKLGVGVGAISTVLLLTIRFIPQMHEEISKIIKAQEVRGGIINTKGLKNKISLYKAIFLPLLYQIFRKAETTANAMEIRKYDIHQNRSKYNNSKMHWQDIFWIILFIGIMWLCLIV